MDERKRIEQARYEGMARAISGSVDAPSTQALLATAPLGAMAVDEPLRRPYITFENAVRNVTRSGAAVLDIGAGTGTHSFAAADVAGSITATDISPGALHIARSRADGHLLSLSVVAADSESLPFRDGSVDVVTSAGVLYCHDLVALTAEVIRVLSPGGHWVIVDSFDHNPIYRFNRVLGRLRGKRTRLAVANIPTDRTIQYLRTQFSEVTVSYHGVFVFAVPLLKRMLGDARAAIIVDVADARMPFLAKFAFKIVVTAKRN